MAEQPEYYTALVNAVNDALLALDKDKPLVAKMLLKQGQFRAEELYAQDAARDGKPVS